jgi:hypothetical protein
LHRVHARHLITSAFVLYLVIAVGQAVLVRLFGRFSLLLGAIVGIIAAFLLQAALVKAVEDVHDSRAALSLRGTVKAIWPSIWRVAGASILAGIGIAIGLALLIVPGLFLLTIWCLIVPGIVLEGVGVGASFRRSQQLVRGYGGSVFGTIIVVFLLLIAVDLVLALVLAVVPATAGDAISGIIPGPLVSPFLAVVGTHIPGRRPKSVRTQANRLAGSRTGGHVVQYWPSGSPAGTSSGGTTFSARSG